MAKPALGRGLGALLGGGSGRSSETKPSESTKTPVTELQKPASASEPAPASVPAIASASAPASVPESVATAAREEVPHAERVRMVSLDLIRPCSFQPRKDFSEEALEELAESIREQGIVQPLIVRPAREGEGGFELIAGERRWRAARKLALTEVPVIVREADDRSALQLALIENLQRENLNPIEEAMGYSELVERFQLTQEDVSSKVGKSRTVIANALRLLRLPPDIQNHVREGRLSVGHAKVILGLTRSDEQCLIAKRILREGANVRQTELWVSQVQQKRGGPSSTTAPSFSNQGKTVPWSRDSHIADLESRLAEKMGTKVHLRYRKGKGSVEIRFFSDEDLERVLELLGLDTG